MRPGYKQTEVGVIPEDWDVLPLGGHVRITSGESPSLIQFSDEGRPYFKVEQLGNDTKYLGNDSTPYHFLRGRTVPRGSVVFAKRGAAIALNRIRIFSDDAFMDTNLMALTSVGSLDPEFIYYKLAHIGLEQFADTTSVPQINNKHINPLRFPFPLLPEQSAIATALSDVDALLSSLGALIAKKHDIKQAAMQQLLTGKTRLPGFEGEWRHVSAGEIGFFRGGTGFPIAFQGEREGTYPFYKVSDMNNEGNQTFMVAANNWVSDDARRVMGATVFAPGSIVFAKVGAAVFLERKKILSKPSCIDNNMAAYVIDETKASVPFIHAQLLAKRFGDLVATTALPSLNGKVLAAMPLYVPSSIAEQTAIAEVLSDMDAELAELEARRDKTHLLKQGMMQELLTGKTRLV